MQASNMLLALSLGAICIAPCAAQVAVQEPASDSVPQDERFNISRFLVEGNTLLPEAEVQAIVTPNLGANRVYGDIQKTLEALERAYRVKGYTTVQVNVPEQELTSGTVRIEVTEAIIGEVTITGNKFFDKVNIRAALPALKEGAVPNMRVISENIQLSNENPAKKVEITLASGDDDNKVDAKITVTDESPHRFSETVDNTGTAATGRLRFGVAYQNGNFLKLDQTLTLAYTTSPDAPGAVRVDIYSIGYRIPLYSLGNSIDLIYGNSSVDTPSTSPTLGAGLGIIGKGDVIGLRFNHYFARRGEYSSKLIFGFDNKYTNARCDLGGVAVSFQPPTPPIASCVPHTSRPLSITYSGQSQGGGAALDYTVGLARNWVIGSRYSNNGTVDRYSYLTPGNRKSRDDFVALRIGGSYQQSFESDWQIRLAANGQHTDAPLIAGEQFGMVGSNAVRGFTERAVAADKGYLANIEAYAPELAKIVNLPGSLRVMAFYDLSRGFNINTAGTTVAAKLGVASTGLGVRYVASKDFTFKADFAMVTDAGPQGTQSRRDRRAHASMLLGF